MKKAVAALGLVAITTACGSTVPMTASTQLPGSAALDPSSTTPPAPRGLRAPSQQGADLAQGPAPVVPGEGAAGGAPQNPVTSTAAHGPGVTATTITVGVSYYQNAQAANAAIGASNVDTGDPVSGTRALVRHLNASGGIAGRRVEVLFYAIDPQSPQPYAAAAQAMCSHFTQDHKVIAVFNGTPAVDATSCLARAGVLVLGGFMLLPRLAPNEVGPYAISLARAHAALVPALERHGWFSPWDRLRGAPGTARARTGIVTVDTPARRAVIDRVLLPALRRSGYAPASEDVIRISPSGGFGDNGAAVAAIQSAVLKLNADGVDHVILDDTNGSLSLLFHNNAYSQGYFPRYGGTTGNAWQVLLSAGTLQASTLRGAVGIGWQPLFDLPYSGQDGPEANAVRRTCFAVFRKAGQPHSDAGTAGGQAQGCDVALLLQSALRGYRGAVNLGPVLQRIELLGTRYPLASGLSARFGPGKHDGIGSIKALRFDEGCGCVSYVGSARSTG